MNINNQDTNTPKKCSILRRREALLSRKPVKPAETEINEGDSIIVMTSTDTITFYWAAKRAGDLAFCTRLESALKAAGLSTAVDLIELPVELSSPLAAYDYSDSA